MNKRIFCEILAIAFAVASFAQSSTRSPYSQYGIGLLSEQSSGFSRGMNGVGLALRQGNVVNTLNPASYSSIDSLTMIFDMGISGQLTNFKEGASKVTAKTASFDFATGGFRLIKNVGMAFGVLPLSNIGYDYNSTETIKNSSTTTTVNYEGSGGLHQAFLGIGWRVFKPLSIGVNGSYLWGSIDRSVESSSTNDVTSMTRYYSASIKSYKLDFGLQWQQPLGKNEVLTIGLTAGLGHKVGDAECQAGDDEKNTTVVSNGYALPMSYGAGLAWKHGAILLIGADFTMQKWGSLDFPAMNGGKYELQSGLLKDRYQLKLGGDFVPNPVGRKLAGRIHYKLGAGYTTPYYKIKGNNGPKELSVSAGVGLPLQNSYNNRSVLNLSVQWVHTSAPNLIVENTFRLNIGLTFNERWFAKWKVD